MTLLDFESAIRAYRKLRERGVGQNEALKQLFENGIGRFELIKAVEVVESIPAPESRKVVTKALAT